MLFIQIAQAANSPGVDAAKSFVNTFNEVILFPIIYLLSAVALLVFMWGCYQYIVKAAEPAARAEGQKHIMWGIIGLFIMLSAYAILSIAANTFGLKDELNCADNPGASGCANVFRVPGEGTTPIMPGNPTGTTPITPGNPTGISPIMPGGQTGTTPIMPGSQQ